MPQFTSGSYTRAQIASALGIKSYQEEQRAVLVRNGQAIAIVVNAKGKHPSGMQYYNELTPTSFVMQGEYDDRGSLIEQPKKKFPLFFSYGTDGSYSFEGYVIHESTENIGLPLRRYRRVDGD